MNIYQKIQSVMKQVAYVKKDAEIKGAGGYKAVSHDMVTALVRPHFIEQGIALHPTLIDATTEASGKTTSSGTPYIRYSGTYDVAFVNVDDPTDRIIVHIQSHAEDTGDKAPGKAISYATKYAILKVLMLETGENDEGRVQGTGLAEDLVNAWLDDIASAASIDTLHKVKDDAFKAAKDALDLDAHKAFKDAVVKRLDELKTGKRAA